MSTINPGPVIKSTADNNYLIIYITIAIIIGLVIIWILVIIFTNEDPLTILSSMNDFTSQIAPVSDKISFTHTQ